MGNTDSVPLVSQLKSLVQYASGDSPAALATQKHFLFNNTFPIISQMSSAGHAINGDWKHAENLQKKFIKDMESVIDSIPVAGHVKGSVHFALGEDEKGEAAMKSASRSTGVVLGGVGGFAAGGPAGAIVGGIAGGAAVDGIITGSEILVHGPTARPHGYIAHGHDIVNAIQGRRRKITTEEGFDMAMVPFSDGLAGYSSGVILGKPLGLNTGRVKMVPVMGVRGTGAKIVTVLDDAGPKPGVLKPSGVKPKLEGNAVSDTKANQMRSHHEVSGQGHSAGYKRTGTKYQFLSI